jgi:nucleotide-binding universal stress UspA family protein
MLDSLEHSIAQAYPDGRPEGLETRVTYGHAAPALIDEAQGADLLVVGSKGHGAFTGMLVGSVSLHCVTSASCPVVVVHGKGRPA